MAKAQVSYIKGVREMEDNTITAQFFVGGIQAFSCDLRTKSKVHHINKLETNLINESSL